MTVDCSCRSPRPAIFDVVDEHGSRPACPTCLGVVFLAVVIVAGREPRVLLRGGVDEDAPLASRS